MSKIVFTRIFEKEKYFGLELTSWRNYIFLFTVAFHIKQNTIAEEDTLTVLKQVLSINKSNIQYFFLHSTFILAYLNLLDWMNKVLSEGVPTYVSHSVAVWLYKLIKETSRNLVKKTSSDMKHSYTKQLIIQHTIYVLSYQISDITVCYT